MTALAWLIFVAAAVLEVGGDAFVRKGLRGNQIAVIAAGCLALGAYGLVVNLVRWDFSKLLGVYVAGAAGPMAAGSGLTTFLGAAVRVINAGHDVEFVLAGRGPDEPDLRRRADRLGIAGRVTFAGDPGDCGAFWDVLDVYCHPAHRPDTGRPLATALAHGLPCIASAVPGLRSLAEDGDTGRLVPPGEPEALAGTILDLLADPAAAADLGHRARASVARRFDPGREAAELAGLYERAMAMELVGPMDLPRMVARPA